MSFDDTRVLLGYQADYLADESEVVVVEKGRRCGISWADAAGAALAASTQRGQGGMNAFYIGYSEDMALDYIKDVGAWSREFNYAAGKMREVMVPDVEQDIKTFVIDYASGFRVAALSSRPRNLRGKQGRITIDEAAFHDDLEELIKSAMALLIWGGQVRIISTHNGEENPFNSLIQDIRSGKFPYSVRRITFQDALESGLYKRICQIKKEDWSSEKERAWVAKIRQQYGAHAEEELDCIPRAGTGSFLHRSLIEKCMRRDIPVLRWTPPEEDFMLRSEEYRRSVVEAWCEDHIAPVLQWMPQHLRTYFGEDFGRKVDRSVVVPLQETPSLDLRVPFVVEMRDMPFEQQRQVVFYIIEHLPRFSGGAMDEGGNGAYLAEVTRQRFGSSIQTITLSSAWYRDHMPKMRARFQDGTIEIPRDADHMDDLRALKLVKGVAKVPENARQKGSDGLDRHGDYAIALALGIYAAQSETEAYEYASAVSDEDREDDSGMGATWATARF